MQQNWAIAAQVSLLGRRYRRMESGQVPVTEDKSPGKFTLMRQVANRRRRV